MNPLGLLTGAAVEVIIKGRDMSAAAFNGARKRVRELGDGLKVVTKAMAAFVAGTAAMVLGLTKLAQRGGEVNDVKASFARLTGDETRALERLRVASGNTISDMELMARHNQALAQGAAESTEEFARMLEAARTLGDALGIDAAQAMDRLADVMASGSQRAARELGLEIRAGATRNEILAEAEAKARALAGAQNDATDAGDRFATAMANARDRLAAFVATSPLVAGFLDTLANLVTTIVAAIEQQDWKLLADTFQAIGETIGDALVFGINKSLEKLVGNGESPLLTIRGLLGSFFGGNASEAGANLRTDFGTLQQLFARARAGGSFEGPLQMPAAAVAGGGVSGVLPGVGVTVSGNVRRPAFGSTMIDRLQLGTRNFINPPTLGPRITQEIPEAAKDFEQAGQVVVASMGAMAEAAIRGGKLTADSVINMMANIVQSIPGVGGFAGALIGAAGGVLGALFGGGRKSEPVPVSLTDVSDRAARQMREKGGPPLRVTTIVEQNGVPVKRIEREFYSRQGRDEVIRYSPVTGDALRGP